MAHNNRREVMQSDSNAQNMSNNKFPSQLSEEMFNNNVIFQSILHVPTLNAGQKVTESFEDFLWSLESENGDDLIEQHPQLEGFIRNVQRNMSRGWFEDHANNLAMDHSNFEFLINIEIDVPFNFRFHKDREKPSNSLGRYFQRHWIFAKDMKDAAEQAINFAKKIRAEEIAKARIEQGLEG